MGWEKSSLGFLFLKQPNVSQGGMVYGRFMSWDGSVWDGIWD
jgi:hypothetical protein